MFDLTKEVKLDKKGEKRYRLLRVLVYLFSILGALYFAYIILFPTAYFTFSFLNPNSTKNNVISPRISGNEIPNKGVFENAEELTFETALMGSYSKVVAEFIISPKSEAISAGSVSLQKSYQSFFYPEGDGIDYTLEKDLNGVIAGDLVAYGDSVHIISGNGIYPIDSIETFLMHGYSWDDLKKTSPDIIASYEKQKLFGLSSPHPNGTFFLTDSGKYYLIKDNQKLPISENSISNLPERNPITVSEKSLEIMDVCSIQKHPVWKKVYSCEISLEKFNELIGLDFQFKADFQNDVRLDHINIRFKKEFSFTSLKNTLVDILRRVKNNYVQ